MRRCVLIALVLLTAAAPADAAPHALTRISGLSDFALAGEQILVTRIHGANVRVVAIPVAGGAAREVFSFGAPTGSRLRSAHLAASPQRAALAITMVKRDRDSTGSLGVFAGPVGGGWSALEPFGDLAPVAGLPRNLQVDGDRVITLERVFATLDRLVHGAARLASGGQVRVLAACPGAHRVDVWAATSSRARGRVRRQTSLCRESACRRRCAR